MYVRLHGCVATYLHVHVLIYAFLESILPDFSLKYFVLPPSQRESTLQFLHTFLQSEIGKDLSFVKAITVSLHVLKSQEHLVSHTFTCTCNIMRLICSMYMYKLKHLDRMYNAEVIICALKIAGIYMYSACMYTCIYIYIYI